ncbi:MAG TPA: hypothetical protein VL359_09280 [bacterium]|nr:hypothetical protein [bacterium]
MKLPTWEAERGEGRPPAVFALPGRRRDDAAARLVYFKDAESNQVFVGYGSPRQGQWRRLGPPAAGDRRRVLTAAPSFLREAGALGLEVLHALGALREEAEAWAHEEATAALMRQPHGPPLLNSVPPESPALDASQSRAVR